MKRALLVLILVLTAFTIGYGATAKAWPISNRNSNYGYFQNQYDNYGWEVLPPSCSGSYNYWNGNGWCNSIPNTVNNGGSFVSFIEDRANGGYNLQTTTGAQFIIHTMIGSPDGQRHRPPTAAQYSLFEALVYNAENAGRISWSTNYNFNINSYWQGAGSGNNYNDDAFFNNSGNGLAIIFSNPSGGAPYVIRRECANPVGVNDVPPVKLWAMSGRTTATNETSATRGSSPAPGDVIRFRHYVRNEGPTATGQDIWFAILDHPSNNTVQGGQNSFQYAAGEEKLVSNSEVIVMPNNATTYCRKVLYDFANSQGGRNGIGAPACVTSVAANYNLTPSINVQINGGAVAGNHAEPGDTVTFTYAVNNTDNGSSSSTACTIYGLSRNGYYPVPSPIDTTSDAGFVQPPHGCPRNFPGNTNTTLVTETVPVASVVANRTICRSLVVNPATPTSGTRGTESCVYVTSKPYSRVYGGDLAAGGGVETAPGVCPVNSGAAIIGWNKRSGSAYAGAGVQFATYAMSTIFDSASSLGNVASGASPPANLSFGNTSTSLANGRFGGSFGSASCIPDHYSTRPATTTALPLSLPSLSPGSYNYGASGNVRITASSINPGVKASIYVAGNLYIDGNITYTGSWTRSNIPMLRVIVSGNIYIDNDVTQLDGFYVAQPNNSSTGVIYTCTSTTAPGPYAAPVLNGSLSTMCDVKLTVNGSFAARQVQLLRTVGTLRQSNATEAATSANIAEVFNYSPIMWIPQPAASSSAAEYDAINSLPPVL